MFLYLQMIETPQEQSKFEILYRRYKGLMFHVAKNILKNESDAEDAVHTAFVKVAENIRKVDDPLDNKTKSYLVTIVEHHAIDVLRKQQRHSTVCLEDVDISIPFVYGGEDPLAICIAQLPSHYRHVLELKYRQGFNNREIASILNLSLANTIKIDQRARKRLQELYEREEVR